MEFVDRFIGLQNRTLRNMTAEHGVNKLHSRPQEVEGFEQ